MLGHRIFGLWLLLAFSAWAEGPTAAERKEAATHYQRGVSLTKEGNFPAALAEFRAAYQAAPSFEVLFNIGLCERRTFRYGQSLRTFDEYLKQGGAKVPADRRAAVAKEIDAVRALTAPIAVIVEGEPALVTIDGEKEGLTPLTQMVPLGPGKHVVHAEREGDVPEDRTIDVVSGQAQAVTFSLKSLTRPVEVVIETKPSGALVSVDGDAALPSPRRTSLKPGAHEVVARLEGRSSARSDVVVQPGLPRTVTLELVAVAAVATVAPRKFPIVGVAVLGVGLVSAGIGAFFATQAAATASRVTTFVQPGAVSWDASWAKTERAGLQQQLLAQILLGAGAGLSVAGLVVTLITAFSEPAPADKPSAHLLFLPSPGGATAACVVSF